MEAQENLGEIISMRKKFSFSIGEAWCKEGTGSGLRRDQVGPGTPRQEVGPSLGGCGKPQMSHKQECVFIWLRWVLVVARGILAVACGIFRCCAWTL